MQSTADQPGLSLWTSPEPTPPARHVAPKPMEFGLSLVKPAGTLAQAALADTAWGMAAAYGPNADE